MICSTSGKKQTFLTRADAERAIARIREHNTKTFACNRAYQCPHCKGWHMTSKPEFKRRAS